MRFKTIAQLLNHIKTTCFLPNFINYREQNHWQALSAAEFYARIKQLTLGLHKMLPRRGENIGIIANPSHLWLISDMSIIISGAITIPIFRRISPKSLQFEIKDASIHYMFIGLKEEYDFVQAHAPAIQIIPMGIELQGKNVLPFEQLLQWGKELDKKQPDLFDRLLNQISESDLATIIYTSGSTGTPKGVELTHQNIISQINAAALRFPLQSSSDKALSSLPLAHIFERMVMYYFISEGIAIYFVDDLKNIAALIREVKPTVMTVVPRLLEKVAARMYARIDETKGWKKKIGLAGFKRAQTKDPADQAKVKDFFYQRLVYKKLNQALGGKLRLVISGAAALSIETGLFFTNIGIPIYEGYGMTEASPVIAANYPGHNEPGTVGPLFPGVSVRITIDGEILARGPGIMRCYHNNRQETEKTIVNQWLHTGDLGKLDENGYLTILGRKKELFKKSTGEYVAPVPIEQALCRHEAVDMAVVIADNRKFTTALIIPDFDNLAAYQQKKDRADMDKAAFIQSDFFIQEITALIRAVNTDLHHTEELQKFRILNQPFSVETGELTPTMKVRRHVVEEKYQQLINCMYEEDEHSIQ